MSRILIDLTDLELWAGNHGGTQRVVYGIAKNFFLQQTNLKQDIEFMSFSAKEQAFYKTSFTPIYERVEAVKNSSSAIATDLGGLSMKARLKYKIRPYVPERIRSSAKARRLAVKTLKAAAAATIKARQLRTDYMKPGPVNTERIELHKTDVVLMLGKPWDDLNIQRYLSLEKAQKGFKLVQVVYDMIIPLNPQLHHPSLFTSYTQHMFEAIAASDLLLPISQSSANDLKTFCKRLNLSVPAMKTIRLGDEVVDVIRDDLAKPDSRIANQFIICVGTIEIRKNHMLLYYAYKLALERKIDLPQLVIVGGRGWLSGDLQYLVEHDPAMNDKIIILDNVNDASLAWTYKNCLFSVYPSMYEGWGLPVAESLAIGKMCVASNSSSVPEIAGDLIEYFSPHDTEACMNLINKYQDQRVLYKKEAEIKANYKTYSWEDTYAQVLKCIQ